MSSLGVVTQPVINNTTTNTGGTLTLGTDQITSGTCTARAVGDLTIDTVPKGEFTTITFSSGLEYCNVDTTGSVGDMFVVKNIGALSGKVRIFAALAGSINSVPAGVGDYLEFSLSSGKKLVYYIHSTAGRISVTYV